MKDDIVLIDSPIERVTKTCERLGIKPTERLLTVRLSTHTLQYYRNFSLVKAYPISTSRRPACNLKGSLGTPSGLHAIAERIGGGQPAGMVFRSRIPTGQHFTEIPGHEAETNLITSRILWLRGLEEGVNLGGEVDTYERYVYLHGTNHEARLGEPLSAGCVLLSNADIIELFEELRAGDLVWIGP